VRSMMLPPTPLWCVELLLHIWWCQVDAT
jgi:hypothetical protein